MSQAGHTEIFRPKFGSHTAVAQELLKSSGEFWRVLETPANLHFLQVHASLLLCGRKPSETVHTAFGEIGALPHNLCALANSWLLNNLSPFWKEHKMHNKPCHQTICMASHIYLATRSTATRALCFGPMEDFPRSKGTTDRCFALVQASVGVIAVATCLQHCISDFGAQECSLLKHKKGLPMMKSLISHVSETKNPVCRF